MLRRSLFRKCSNAVDDFSTMDICYMLYERTSLNPSGAIDALYQLYETIHGVPAQSLVEDYAVTGSHAVEWVKRSGDNRAIAVHSDPRGFGYTMKRVAREKIIAATSRKERLQFMVGDVLNLPDTHYSTHIACALNFSWLSIHTPAALDAYIESVLRRTVEGQRMLVLDVFGGMSSETTGEWVKEYDGYAYMWRQTSWSARTRMLECNASFAIPPSDDDPEPTHLTADVFQYLWRVWRPEEISESILRVSKQMREKGDGSLGDGFSNVEWWVTHAGGSYGGGGDSSSSSEVQQPQPLSNPMGQFELRKVTKVPDAAAWTMLIVAH